MPDNELLGVMTTPELWFSYAGQLAMCGWFILIFLPRRFKLLFYIPQYLIPLVLALLYAGLILTHFFTSPGGFASLHSVRQLFINDYMLLAGWVHYLAFDLFIAAWIAQKSDRLGLSRLLQAPILLATFMFGPLGLALYFTISATFYSANKYTESQHA